MRRLRRLLPTLVAILATWAISSASTGAAQGSIPDGVFVRNSEGLVWLVLEGQRIKIPVWAATDEEIAAVPVSDRWAVMNDTGSIVAGDMPSWLGSSGAGAPAVPPVAQQPPPTAAAPPTSTPLPAADPSGRTITLKGKGRTATESITPPSSANVATFKHDGRRNFIVTVVREKQELLVNTIGDYRGQRPIGGSEPFVLDIDADGEWSVEISPIQPGGQAAFSGHGDAVSAMFDPPPSGAWTLSHDGQRNFVVTLHCQGGTQLIENMIGSIDGSAVISFKRGPCIWEVEADGNWRLAPR